MLKDKRKAPRKSLRYSAWIALSDRLHGCVVTDISDTGAKIGVEDSQILPEKFVLFLSGRNGKARRFCRVMWRQPEHLGVEFVKNVPAAVDAMAVKLMGKAPEPKLEPAAERA